MVGHSHEIILTAKFPYGIHFMPASQKLQGLIVHIEFNSFPHSMMIHTRTMHAYDAKRHVQVGHVAQVPGIARLVGVKEQYKTMVT